MSKNKGNALESVSLTGYNELFASTVSTPAAEQTNILLTSYMCHVIVIFKVDLKTGSKAGFEIL